MPILFLQLEMRMGNGAEKETGDNKQVAKGVEEMLKAAIRFRKRNPES